MTGVRASLWLVPAIAVVWANLHGNFGAGSALAGVRVGGGPQPAAPLGPVDAVVHGRDDRGRDRQPVRARARSYVADLSTNPESAERSTSGSRRASPRPAGSCSTSCSWPSPSSPCANAAGWGARLVELALFALIGASADTRGDLVVARGSGPARRPVPRSGASHTNALGSSTWRSPPVWWSRAWCSCRGS